MGAAATATDLGNRLARGPAGIATRYGVLVASSRDASDFRFERGSTAHRASSHAPLLAGALLTLMLAALLAGMYVYDRSRSDLIANGVRVGGVNVGGLKPDAARRRLDSALLAPLQRPVTVAFGSRTFAITGRQAHIRLDVNVLVQQALDRSRSGSIFSRTLRELLDGRVSANIPAAVHYDRAVVRALTARVRAAAERPAQEASAQPNASGLLSSVPSHDGVKVDARLLGARVGYSLTHPGGPRTVPAPVHVIRPSVTTSQLAARYASYIVVDRNTFTLRLYEHLKLTRSYPIAVGMQGLQTPVGLWHIQWEQVNPPWYVPHDAWTGSLAGQVIPPPPIRSRRATCPSTTAPASTASTPANTTRSATPPRTDASG